MSTGEFNELHFNVDKHFYGGRLPGGGGWSGRKLGWEKYDPLRRLWYGATKPMKYTVLGGGALATGAAVDGVPKGEGRR